MKEPWKTPQFRERPMAFPTISCAGPCFPRENGGTNCIRAALSLTFGWRDGRPTGRFRKPAIFLSSTALALMRMA